jgi:hypothetical protein
MPYNYIYIFLELFKKIICNDPLIQPNPLTIGLGRFGFIIQNTNFTSNSIHLTSLRSDKNLVKIDPTNPGTLLLPR